MPSPQLVMAAVLALLLAATPVRGDFGAAELALAGGDFARVHDELAPLVARDDARALNLMGVLCQNGWGVERDVERAVALYRRAAALGLTRAVHNLGRMYRAGLGVPRDDTEAARLWKISARQAYVPSQAALGFLYYAGDGVEKDVFRAYFWWSLAARRFDLESVRAREDVIYLLSPHEKAVADQLVARFEPDI